MEITGKLYKILEEKQIKETFKKREFWIQMPGERPQTITLEFVQGYTEKLDSFREGQEVVAKFTLMGREYNGKCYNTLQAYSLEAVGAKVMPIKEEETDLPF